MSEQISLDLYDVFVAVADAQSITEAARRMRTTKATVSRALAKLEAELGTELVHRSTRSMSLSAAGVALYERVAPSVGALRDTARALSSKRDAPRGTLRITAPVDFGQHLLPDVLALVASRFPDLVIDARLSNDVVDLVREGFDLALRIVVDTQKDSSLTSRKVGTITMSAYASPAYLARRGGPKKLGDDAHDWLTHPTLRRGLPKSLAPKLVANDMAMLREAAVRGLGVAVLADFVAAPAVVAGALTRVLPDAATNAASVALVFPSSGAQVPRNVEVFRDAVVETLRARPLPRAAD